MKGFAGTAFIVFLVLLASFAFAQGAEPTLADAVKGINTMWVLIAAFLVFFMQAGFAMVETGFTRAKNAVNIMGKNLMDFAIGSLAFFIVGFGIMFGAGNALFGTTGFLVQGFGSEMSGVPTLAFWFFQAVFAATAATIVSGAMSERTNFKAYLLYSFIVSLIIYPVIGHWIWGGGWLQQMGMLDFAGSTVVHATGGWIAFIGALLLGPRIGKFNKDGSANVIAGHSIPLAALGVFILWFGWFGFNPGSTLSGIDAELIAKVAVNTNLAAAAGATMALLFSWAKFKKPDVTFALNGSLAGLVAITAGCAFVSPIAAIIIGIVGGIIVVAGVPLMDRIKIDDPVGAVAVHAFNGVWGTIAVGIFHETLGLASGAGTHLLFVQTIGTVAVSAFAVASMFIVFKAIDIAVGLRVNREEELIGLDLGEHGVEGYAGFEIFTTE